MPRLLSKPLAKTFTIEDPEGDWTVSFNQLTEGDYISLVDLESKRDLLYDRDGAFSGVREEFNLRRSRRRAVYLSMAACSLVYDDDKQLLFDSKDGWVKKQMGESAFNRVWDTLPPEVAKVLIDKFEEVNPTLKRGE